MCCLYKNTFTSFINYHSSVLNEVSCTIKFCLCYICENTFTLQLTFQCQIWKCAHFALCRHAILLWNVYPHIGHLQEKEALQHVNHGSSVAQNPWSSIFSRITGEVSKWRPLYILGSELLLFLHKITPWGVDSCTASHKLIFPGEVEEPKTRNKSCDRAIFSAFCDSNGEGHFVSTNFLCRVSSVSRI